MKYFTFTIQGKLYKYRTVKSMIYWKSYYEAKGLKLDEQSIKIIRRG